MASAEDFINVKDQLHHIKAILVIKLKKLREECPEHFSMPIHILSTINDNVQGQIQFEQLLQQESRDHTGERIVLIPYYLENSHWIGIMIKFQANGQITTVEYIDPLYGTNAVPDRLQNRFTQVYSDIMIQSRDLLKSDDPRCSGILTTKNLLAAAGNIQLLKEFNRVNDGNDDEKEMKVFWNEISNLDLDGFSPPNDDRIRELEEILRVGLVNFHFEDATILPGEIQDTRERIKKYEQQRRTDAVQSEMKFLNELRELNELAELISTLKSISHTPTIHPIEADKKQVYLRTLREDLSAIPICVERTLIELLLQLEGETSFQQKNSVRTVLHTLKDQLKIEELLSETNRIILQDLDMYISSNDYRSAVRRVEELWKQIRPLNVSEIRRLVAKSKETADLIQDKEIILLVGETGTGKSTTIQFLAGSTMETTRIEIAPEKFLEHITSVGPVKNPQLNNVISSPFSRSETRYLIPVTIQLKDILGAHETGMLILCDAPGFDDTSGAEVDIANSIGTIEALKGTKSVKILALSSYQSLGDRGQGIEKLANILISMVNQIEDKLSSIVYAFTKYPEKVNINALLHSLKTSRVDQDSTSQFNCALGTVLCDMIEKTEKTVYKIDPIHDNPKILIKKLNGIRGILYPKEVFRLAMSESAQAYILKQIQNDKFSIIRAMNCRDIKLVSYYLNELKILNDLIKKNDVRDTYEYSIEFVSENIRNQCTEAMEKFNRALTSLDGLNEKDILDYKTSVDYLTQAQILKEYLGSSLLLTTETLMQNIMSQLHERLLLLEKEELHSALVKIYFNNLYMLKNTFQELETYYNNSSKEYEKRFEELVQSAYEPIQTNDFSHIAEIFLKLSRSLSILKVYLGEHIEVKYRDIIQSLLRHLDTLSNKANDILVKFRLNDTEIEILKTNIAILKSAKENPLLQTCVVSIMSQTTSKSLTSIYEEFLEKIAIYFDKITVKINELLTTDRTHALEDVEKLVNDMNIFREFPELKSKTTQKYDQTADNIRNYMFQSQANVEKLIVSLQQQQQQQSKTVIYKNLARLVSRLANASWINTILPGTHDTIMHRLTDEFIEYAKPLEIALRKLDLSWKCPDNIGVSLEIIENIEATSILERNIPDLQTYRVQIAEYFQRSIQEVFDRISEIFIIQPETEIKLDASKVNNVLIYLIQCEKINYYHIRESANEIHEKLHKYISEYGQFLNEKISKTFKYICQIGEDRPSRYSEELKNSLNELSSMSKFPHVFKYVEGTEKIEHWLSEFRDYYRTISANLEEYKCFHRNKELRDHLAIAQALISVDQFCATIFNNHGFHSLHTEYQLERTRASKEAYKNLLDYISKEDYAKADIVLHDIDKDLLSTNDSCRIKHELDNSLESLMKKTNSSVIWLDKKFERENKNNQDQIMKIKESIDKIRIALNKSNIMDLVDHDIRAHLENFDNEINEILSGILLTGYNTIEVYIDTDHFLEADQGLENLSHIQRDLTGYCTSLRVIENKNEELRERLDSTINNFLKGEDFANLDNYSIHPPKELLEKFQMLAKHGNIRYNEKYSSMLKVIKKNFNLAIEKARESPSHERNTKIYSLKNALYFLPEDLQIHFKLQIDDLNALITIKEKPKKEDSNNQNIIKIGTLAQQYQTQNKQEHFEELREQTLTALREDEMNIQNYLDKQQIRSAMNMMRRIVQYKEFVGSYFPEIEEIFNRIHLLVTNDFLHCCESFTNISSIEETHVVENAFNRLIIYFDFSNTLDKTMLENAREKLQIFYAYFKVNSEHFQTALNQMNLIELLRIMMISKKWNELIKKAIQVFPNEMKGVISYTEMISQLEKTINQLDLNLVANSQFEQELHENSMKILNIIKALKTSDYKDILPPTLNREKLEERLKKKINDCGNQLISSVSKTDLLTRDSDYFHSCYNYLLSFNENNVLNDFKEKVFERITFLCEQITTTISDVIKVAELLIKLKYFSEKFSMFKDQIDSKIDKILHIVKEHENQLQIKQLIMTLTRSDVGQRLINNYHYLNGEDWRNRWKKMQNQHNLVYVLGNLHGDYIDKNILTTYYNSFEQIYKNIISKVFETDLEALSSHIKKMAAVLIQTFTTGTWDYRIIDGIIQLIAHLFALWTLTNTQYYTKTHPYLLIPHVVQVIAIFRILGIDSAVHMPITGSNFLVNHLVEIGSGEGKSVVLGITACIFALIGFDVNCSCYNEDLSMRDRNTFSCIFRALALEEHITYGTFHQLCEQLVNEQCNVREKVRDMILNNKIKLAVDQVKIRTRRKVLLIDEVDVFLSDKFYGGLYTPSVIIKSNSIQMLFDAIWQNKTLKSLNSVQALPAYKACMEKYSNWIFVLDDAIKDMLVALESFQISNSVDGESIADNVLRTYRTMWTYYHESDRENISSSNVGLIVNCGIFSYAEIPHDFSYIAGVTGTLSTVIQTEKDILKRVYAIHRNTYLPSVFGKNNRTFNPATDIHVVKESDYFIKIREEIDTRCKSNRAILVIFESEEKLMTFYDSTELSSMKHHVQLITETVSIKDRELCMECATVVGTVTLLTRRFSRGLDFICRDPQLLAAGGIHVLQTFFSEELSEEYQIMARGARHSDPGSYSMILVDRDLKSVFGSAWKEGITLYETLNKARHDHHEIKCIVKHRNIEQCRLEHRNSLDFMFALCTGEMMTVKRFLSEQNKRANLSPLIRLQF